MPYGIMEQQNDAAVNHGTAGGGTDLGRPLRRVAEGVHVRRQLGRGRRAALDVGDDDGHVVFVNALVSPERISEGVAALACAEGQSHLLPDGGRRAGIH